MILCRLGFHKWKYSKRFKETKIEGMPLVVVRRYCVRCEKNQVADYLLLFPYPLRDIDFKDTIKLPLRGYSNNR